ncbi:MAG: NAD(P)H-dependent oxidoreductase [Candidatus Micrarchaeia archaeon]|jgi:multimeric flavodoxin WrbA
MIWICRVCGYRHKGRRPPRECPQCGSFGDEYYLEKPVLDYNGEKLDVLLVNGSSHKAHNTSSLVDVAEDELKRRKLRYRRIDLNQVNVQHCWCCYSMGNKQCTYPCRNQLDEMPKLHEMLLNSKAVIVASPINWNNMSARLKDFLDRLTCIQNLPLLGKESPTAGKAVAILVNGHEDGAMKTALDIFVYFQQMGYVLVPYGFAYRTHGAGRDAKTDNAFFKNDAFTKGQVVNVVGNLAEFIRMGVEQKSKNRIKPVAE